MKSTKNVKNTFLAKSTETLKVSDIQSKHSLYRLVPWELRTEGIESSLSHIGLLKTPCAMDPWSENLESKSKSGTSGTLAQEIISRYAQKRWKGLLLTPTAAQAGPEPPERVRTRYEAKGSKNGSRYNSLASQIMYDPIWKELLPTPTAGEGEKYSSRYNPSSQMGRSLSAMAGSGLLPTPRANNVTDLNLNSQTLANRHHANLEESIAACVRDLKTDGEIFRLSPLFTEEMMGFPLLWTVYPFLLQNGKGKR